MKQQQAPTFKPTAGSWTAAPAHRGDACYDFKTGKFVNDAEADALLFREPRKG